MVVWKSSQLDSNHKYIYEKFLGGNTNAKNNIQDF